MRAWPLSSLNQLFHNMSGRSSVRISHAEVNNVIAAFPRGTLQLTNYVEHVRRQPSNPSEFIHGVPFRN
jgi:hypothetical protein